MAEGVGAPPGDAALTTALARIAALESEVAELRTQAATAPPTVALRTRLTQVGAAGVLDAPAEHSILLEQIVSTAMAVLHARGGSLYLVADDGEALIFEVALGDKASSLKGRRLPIGQGIAGWVAATGQAIAVADVQRDPRWLREFGSTADYAPRTMLVVPLLVNDDVTGVLQLLDKEGDTTFDAADMHLLGLFAQQAAVAIAQSRALGSLGALVRASLAPYSAEANAEVERLVTFADQVGQGDEYRDTMQLAALLASLGRAGDGSRRLGLDVVGAIARYVGASPAADGYPDAEGGRA